MYYLKSEFYLLVNYLNIYIIIIIYYRNELISHNSYYPNSIYLTFMYYPKYDFFEINYYRNELPTTITQLLTIEKGPSSLKVLISLYLPFLFYLL